MLGCVFARTGTSVTGSERRWLSGWGDGGVIGEFGVWSPNRAAAPALICCIPLGRSAIDHPSGTPATNSRPIPVSATRLASRDRIGAAGTSQADGGCGAERGQQ